MTDGGRLRGKVALVTGAARGLGAATAQQFCREGAIVHLADLAVDDGQRLVQTLTEAGYEASFHALDVTDEAQWTTTVGEIEQRHGRLDILVNNAGVALPIVPLEHRAVAEWDLIMAVNAKGVFLGVRAVIPLMRRAGSGAIVNLSSAAGLGQWQIMEGAYAASKAAVRVLTKVVAAQYATAGIRCNSIHPGPIDSDMVQAVLGANPDILTHRLSRVPMGRLGRPEEVVAAIVFLASDEASYITGSELSVDGGAIAQ